MRFLKAVFSVDRLIGYSMLAVFVALKFSNPYPVEFLKLKVFDYYQQLKPRPIPDPKDKPVMIIDIDETSLTKIGQWPWPRTKIAELVKKTRDYGASLIAFDIVFAEKDRLNPQNIVDSVFGLDDETRAKIMALRSNDSVLSDQLKQFPVVLGQAGRQAKVEGQKSTKPIKKTVMEMRKKGALDPRVFLPSFPYMTKNIPILEKGNHPIYGGFGLFNVIPDRDGMIRNVPAFFVHDFCDEAGITEKKKKKKCQIIYPGIGPEMLRVNTYLTSKKRKPRRALMVTVDPAGIRDVKVDKKLKIRTDKNGRIWPYFSNMDTAKYVPAIDILEGTADPSLLKGKMTIVGTSAVGLKDIKPVPTEPLMPGVEVHAQIVETALEGTYLERPGYFDVAEPTFIFLIGLILVILIPWIGAKWTAIVFISSVVFAGGYSWHLFANERILLDATAAILSLTSIYMVLTYTSYAREEAQKKQTRAAFSKYLSPDMVSRVAENPDELKLGGEQREMTLLFCDVRGFTTISEQFDAVGLTSLINKLLTPLTNVILERHGTIDKYMGDCIMAFWNAPLDDGNPEYNGCTSALAMLGEMGPLNDRLEQEAIEEGRKHIPLKVGLGLNTGPCVVGNMGSDMRFDYSVLGDAVNLAARLEGQSKSYGMNVVLGPSTRGVIEDRLATIDLDFIQVKGKTEGVYIYGLMGDEEVRADPEFQKIKKMIEEAMELYRSQKWDDAALLFNQLRTLGDDEHKCWHLDANLEVLCDLYEERIQEYKESPPAEDWDGVFIATTK